MAAMMTRSALEEQYADIEAVLMQAIDGQDVKDEMEAGSDSSTERQHRIEEIADFLIREDMLLTALELHQEAREPGRRLAPVRVLEETFGSAAAVQELVGELQQSEKTQAAEAAAMGKATGGIVSLAHLRNPVATGGLATALEAREQAIAVAEYRLRGAQRDASEAATEAASARAEAAQLRSRVVSAGPPGAESASTTAETGSETGASKQAVVTEARMSDIETSRLDKLVLGYLEQRGFAVAAVSLQEAVGTVADDATLQQFTLPQLFQGTARPLAHIQEAAAREKVTAARVADLESQLDTARKELSQEIGRHRAAQADIQQLRTQAGLAETTEASSAAAVVQAAKPKSVSSSHDTATSVITSPALADPAALLGKLTKTLPRLAGILSARQRVDLLPLFAGAACAHPDAASRRSLLTGMTTLIKRPRAAERAALVREIASIARAAAEGHTGVHLTQSEVVEAVVGLATQRARERRAAAGLACGAVAPYCDCNSLLATLSMLAGGGGRVSDRHALVRRAALRGAASLAAAVAAKAAAASTSLVGGISLTVSETKAMKRQYLSLLELLWGFVSGVDEAGGTDSDGIAGRGTGGDGGGDDDDDDDDDANDGDLGRLLAVTAASAELAAVSRSHGSGTSGSRSAGAAAAAAAAGSGSSGSGANASGAEGSSSGSGTDGIDILGSRPNGLGISPSLPLLAAGKLVPALVELAHAVGLLWGHRDATGWTKSASSHPTHDDAADTATRKTMIDDDDDSDALMPALMGRLGVAVEEAGAAGGAAREAGAAEAVHVLRCVAAVTPALRRLVLVEGYTVGRVEDTDSAAADDGASDSATAEEVVAEAKDGAVDVVRVVQSPIADEVEVSAASTASGLSGWSLSALDTGLASAGSTDTESEATLLRSEAVRHALRMAAAMDAILCGEAVLATRNDGIWCPARQALTRDSAASVGGSFYLSWPALRRFIRDVLCGGILSAAASASPATAAGRRVRGAAAACLRVVSDAFGAGMVSHVVRPCLHFSLGLACRLPEDGPDDDGPLYKSASSPSSAAALLACRALGLVDHEAIAPVLLPSSSVLSNQIMLGTVGGALQTSSLVLSTATADASGWRAWWEVLPEMASWLQLSTDAKERRGVTLAEQLLPAVGRGLLGSLRLSRPLLASTLRALIVLPVQRRAGWSSTQRPHVESALAEACAGSAHAAADVLQVLQRVGTNSDPHTRQAVGAAVGALLAASALPASTVLKSAVPLLEDLCCDSDASVRQAAVRGACAVFASHSLPEVVTAASRAAGEAVRLGPKDVVLEAVRGMTRAVPRAAPGTRDGQLLASVKLVVEALLEAGEAGYSAMMDVCGRMGGDDAVALITGTADVEVADDEVTGAAAAAARVSRDAAVQGASPWGGARWDDLEEVAMACAEALRAYVPMAATMSDSAKKEWKLLCDRLVSDAGEGAKYCLLDQDYRETVLMMLAGTLRSSSDGDVHEDEQDAITAPGQHTTSSPSWREESSSHTDGPAAATADFSEFVGAAVGVTGAGGEDVGDSDGEVSMDAFMGAPAPSTHTDTVGGGDTASTPFVPDDAPTDGRRGALGRLRGRLQNARQFFKRDQA